MHACIPSCVWHVHGVSTQVRRGGVRRDREGGAQGGWLLHHQPHGRRRVSGAARGRHGALHGHRRAGGAVQAEPCRGGLEARGALSRGLGATGGARDVMAGGEWQAESETHRHERRLSASTTMHTEFAVPRSWDASGPRTPGRAPVSGPWHVPQAACGRGPRRVPRWRVPRVPRVARGVCMAACVELRELDASVMGVSSHVRALSAVTSLSESDSSHL